MHIEQPFDIFQKYSTWLVALDVAENVVDAVCTGVLQQDAMEKEPQETQVNESRLRSLGEGRKGPRVPSPLVWGVLRQRKCWSKMRRVRRAEGVGA